MYWPGAKCRCEAFSSGPPGFFRSELLSKAMLFYVFEGEESKKIGPESGNFPGRALRAVKIAKLSSNAWGRSSGPVGPETLEISEIF